MGNNDLDALRSRTVLCRVVTKALGTTRVDRRTKIAAQQAGALTDDVKVLIPTNTAYTDIHAVLTNAQVDARNALRSVSMPYGDDEGWRILPHAMLQKFLVGFQKAKQNFDGARSGYISANGAATVTYGQHTPVNEIPDETEVAKARAVADAYSLTWRVQDYPACAFPGMDEKTAAALKGRLEANLARVVASTLNHAAGRLTEPVLHLIQRLEVHMRSLEGGGRNALRSSVITNIADAIELVGVFNVTENTLISDMLDTTRPLAELNFDLLRADAKAAQEAHACASGVVSRLQNNTAYLALTHNG